MDRYKVAIVDDDELSLDNLVFGKVLHAMEYPGRN